MACSSRLLRETCILLRAWLRIPSRSPLPLRVWLKAVHHCPTSLLGRIWGYEQVHSLDAPLKSPPER